MAKNINFQSALCIWTRVMKIIHLFSTKSVHSLLTMSIFEIQIIQNDFLFQLTLDRLPHFSVSILFLKISICVIGTKNFVRIFSINQRLPFSGWKLLGISDRSSCRRIIVTVTCRGRSSHFGSGFLNRRNSNAVFLPISLYL